MKKYYSVIFAVPDEPDRYDCFNYIKWNRIPKDKLKLLPEDSIVDLISINKNEQFEKGTYVKVSKEYFDESVREELDGLAEFIELNDNVGLFISYEEDDF